jgi:predicted nucleotidyltransferase
MIQHSVKTLPDSHRHFIDTAVVRLATDPRVVGLAVAGSYLDDAMDEFSDLDLVIAVEPEHFAAVLDDRRTIAASLGSLLGAFTGEHVGEPRLLVCLYDSPLLHVDLKFVSVDDAAIKRVDNPKVLWERADRLSQALSAGTGAYPQPDPQWIEDRFWIWIHYIATRIGRGERYEALECLGFLRANVLGPLGMHALGLRPAGVRRLDLLAPSLAEELQRTVADYDTASLIAATEGCIAVYHRLRASEHGPLQSHATLERAAIAYLESVAARFAAP